MSYKHKLFLYFLVIFSVLTSVLVAFEQKNEENEKQHSLEKVLNADALIIYSYIINNQLDADNISQVSTIMPLFPKELRITIIDKKGNVVFDNDIADLQTAENHLNRIEIRKSLTADFGSNIRNSTTLNRPYFYYAKYFDNKYFVRTALPYDKTTKKFLKADNHFIYFALAAFLAGLLLLNYVSNRFAKSISQLRTFARSAKNDDSLPEHIDFQDDELGEIGQDLVEIFEQKANALRSAETEKDKLLQHFTHSNRGIAIFDERLKKIFANSHFIQNQNLILKEPTFDVENIFEDENFTPLKNFVTRKKEKLKHFQIEKNGKIFEIRAIFYEDNSLEISINDITDTEKNQMLKQEMTSNIAHELRTPVTSIRGYLETLNEQNLSVEKRKIFIERAYIQSVRLSSLIDDVSLLSKIESDNLNFPMENLNICQLINDVHIDLHEQMKHKHIALQVDVNEQLTANANYTLFYSVFRNLMDNSIAYAGENITIFINNYLEDSQFLYFSYSDNGKGVEQQHLNRIFERFYRIQEGRMRQNGGSGLGLSIVKNAVQMHGGEINARNREGGGLEFLFTIKL